MFPPSLSFFRALFTSRSIYGVGPPAPEQKSTNVYFVMDGPRTVWSVRATREAGDAGCRIGALYSQKKVRPAWTKARRGAGNLESGPWRQWFVGEDDSGWKLVTRTGRRFRKDGEGGWGEGAPSRWTVEWKDRRNGGNPCLFSKSGQKLGFCYGSRDPHFCSRAGYLTAFQKICVPRA